MIDKEEIEKRLDAVEELNAILHDFGPYVIGRMGIPYHARNIHIISVVVDAPQNVISTLSGRLGRIRGVSVKTAYSNVITPAEETVLCVS